MITERLFIQQIVLNFGVLPYFHCCQCASVYNGWAISLHQCTLYILFNLFQLLLLFVLKLLH